MPRDPARPAAYRSVPVLGRIAAGQPLLAEENREGELPLAATALPGSGEDVFALRVRGDSMIDAHICEGDLVLVRRQDSAQPNDIVVALVESAAGEEATVKRFFRDGPRVVLKPEHPTMAPIVVDPRERHVQIIGKVVGLLRGF
jgi:repressor LexA